MYWTEDDFEPLNLIDLVRLAIDKAVRLRRAADPARDMALLNEQGLCGHCEGPIPPSTKRGTPKKFCQEICRKRYHYPTDCARAHAKVEARKLVI